MKIILVSPYSEHLVGGIINWTKYIVNYHRDNTNDVDLCLLNNEQAVGLYGTGYIFQRIRTGLSNYLPIYRNFKEIVKREHFDLVHISSSASYGLLRDLLIVRYARKKGVKTAVHMHFGRIPQILKAKGWERFLFISLLKRIDCAIVMDMSSYNALKEAGYDNVRYLPNPLSTEVQQLIEKHKNVCREPRKIIFAGHVVRTKGVFELVEACSGIKNIKLELLGKVIEEGNIEQLFKLAGNDAKSWLNIPGNKTLEDVIVEMKTCAVFALPTYSEGFPNVILESMACGCPIVTTLVGAIPEMLDINGSSPCGICVEPKNVEALKEAIIKLLEDNDYAQTISERAVRRVNEYYAIEKVWVQLTEIWRFILSFKN